MDTIWTISEQKPRERLVRIGPSNLSDIELITSVIGSGNGSLAALEIAVKLYKTYNGSLKKIFSTHHKEFQKVRGIGYATYCSLISGMELGRRMILRNEDKGIQIKTSKHAYKIIREFIPANDMETIIGLYLDSRNRILAMDELSFRKSPSSSELNLRQLLKTLLNINASSMILAHNHPSNNSNPSRQDRIMSQKLDALLSSLDVKLLDHLIITSDGYKNVQWEK